MAAVLENLATASLTVLALALSLIALRAWYHTRSTKIALLAVAFALFFVKGLLLSYGLFRWPDWGERLLGASIALDVIALVLFYLAVFRRSRA